MAMAGLVGFVLGLLGAIPIAGPIAVLVIARGLDGHIRSAISIAVGSAVAEGGYAALAFWGLGALIAEYAWIDTLARGLGAGILGAVALLLMRVPEPVHRPGPARPEVRGGFALGFGVAAANPTLIASWAAAVTALHATGLVDATPANTGVFAAGTTLGIVTWSAGLVYVLWRLRERFDSIVLMRVRRTAGFLVLGLAFVFLYRFGVSFAALDPF